MQSSFECVATLFVKLTFYINFSPRCAILYRTRLFTDIQKRNCTRLKTTKKNEFGANCVRGIGQLQFFCVGSGDPDPNKASAGNDRNKSDRDVTSSEGAESEVSQPLSISYGVTEPLLRDTADSLVDAPRSSNSQSPDSQSKRVTRSSARKRGKSGASSTDESAGTVLKVASDLFGPSSKKRRTHVSPCSVAKGQESDRGKTAPEKNPDVQSAVATKLSSPPLQPIAQKRDPVPCPAEQGGGSDSAAASARVAHSFPSVAATALATQRPTVRIRAKQKQRTIAKVTVVAKVNMSNSDASRPSTSTDVLGQILKVQDAPTAARGGASKTADVRPDVASVPVDLEPRYFVTSCFSQKTTYGCVRRCVTSGGCGDWLEISNDAHL